MISPLDSWEDELRWCRGITIGRVGILSDVVLMLGGNVVGWSVDAGWEWCWMEF